MNFQQYVSENRTSKKNKPNQDIVERWQVRVVAAAMHLQGERGAEQYLSLYGKSVGSPKCIMFARYAEEQGYPEFALGMWKKAYLIDNPGEIIHAEGVLDGVHVPYSEFQLEAQGETCSDCGLPSHDLESIAGMSVKCPACRKVRWGTENPEPFSLPRHPSEKILDAWVNGTRDFPADMQPGQLGTGRLPDGHNFWTVTSCGIQRICRIARSTIINPLGDSRSITIRSKKWIFLTG